MQPGRFDPETAREVVGDTLSRTIEAKARADADNGSFDPPQGVGATYWECVQTEMQAVVYRTQFQKRTKRIARKAMLNKEN